MSCGSCPTCNENSRWVCRKEGNFYTTGEYANIIEFFDISGVTLNQRIDSVKMLLDSNTIQILKVLLVDIDAPVKFDYETELDIVHLLDFIQSRLSNDNSENEKFSDNSLGGDDK